MTFSNYQKIENFMLTCMQDSAHDHAHIYRVLHAAVDIASTEPETDWDILIAACLLHDIGRERQYQNPALCHAQEGATLAVSFLIAEGWTEERANHVGDCIRTHRYRTDAPPKTIEAKILFDADKLDATGALAVARTLLYEGHENIPLYLCDKQGRMLEDGGGDSFFGEYGFKLQHIYKNFYTARGASLGRARKAAAEAYHRALKEEITAFTERGIGEIQRFLKKSESER